MMMFTQEQQLGQLLVSQGKLDPDDLEQAVREHHKSGDRLSSVLIRLGVSNEEDVQRAVDLMADGQVRRIPIVDSQHRVLGIIAQGDVATRLGQPETTARVVKEISRPAVEA